jgi:hypothetical protein
LRKNVISLKKIWRPKLEIPDNTVPSKDVLGTSFWYERDAPGTTRFLS